MSASFIASTGIEHPTDEVPCVVCLWGNSTDLSLLIDMTEEDIKKLQSTGGDHLSSAEKNIIGNDLDKITAKVASFKGARIDFVLDNAGFELYCDVSHPRGCHGNLRADEGFCQLVYADWLIQSGICREIVFHGKKVSLHQRLYTDDEADLCLSFLDPVVRVRRHQA